MIRCRAMDFNRAAAQLAFTFFNGSSHADIWNSTQNIIKTGAAKNFPLNFTFQYNNITFCIPALYQFEDNIILEIFSINNHENIKILKIRRLQINGQGISEPHNAVSYFNTPARKPRTEMNFEKVSSLDFIVGDTLITSITKS